MVASGSDERSVIAEASASEMRTAVGIDRLLMLCDVLDRASPFVKIEVLRARGREEKARIVLDTAVTP